MSTNCQAQYADVSDGQAVVSGETGNADKSGCNWEDEVNSTVYVPIFSSWEGNGSNAEVTIHRFAVFELLGVQIQGNKRHGFDANPLGCTTKPEYGKWMGHCIFGRFVEYVDIGDDFELGSPTGGEKSLIVRLKD